MKPLLPALALLAACATSGDASRLGILSVRDYDSRDSQPWEFGVYPGRIRNPSLDVSIEGDCARGVLGHSPVRLCREQGSTHGFERWAGSSGELELRPSEDGSALRVEGWFGTRGTTSRRPVRTALPYGDGPQADELRRHPVLLAIAGAALGIFGDPPPPGAR